MGNLYATEGIQYDSSPYDSHVFCMVYYQPGFHNGARRQIDGAVAWDADVSAGQIFGAVHAGCEIYEACILYKHIMVIASAPFYSRRFVGSVMLLQHRVGKDMQIMESVAIKLYRQVFGLLQFQFYRLFVNHSGCDVLRFGAYRYVGLRHVDVLCERPDSDVYHAVGIKLSKRCLRPFCRVYVA